MPPTTPDIEIIEFAARESRTILTQDLDFSALIALSQRNQPSVMSLRLTTSLVDVVNAILLRIMLALEKEVAQGVLVSVTSHRVRKRKLPLC